MSAVRSKPELATHSEVSRMEFPRAAAKLKDVLGARLVAYLGDVSETRAVREWATECESRPKASSSGCDWHSPSR